MDRPPTIAEVQIDFSNDSRLREAIPGTRLHRIIHESLPVKSAKYLLRHMTVTSMQINFIDGNNSDTAAAIDNNEALKRQQQQQQQSYHKTRKRQRLI